jgi:predicted ester cyclase
MGLGPTQKQVQWLGISVDRIESGKIAENWVSWGMMSMLQQLGAVSWPPRP